MLSPTTSSHDQTIKLTAYERAGVPEVWLVHPTDRIVSVYCLSDSAYPRPRIYEMSGALALSRRPEISIDWERVLALLEA